MLSPLTSSGDVVLNPIPSWPPRATLLGCDSLKPTTFLHQGKVPFSLNHYNLVDVHFPDARLIRVVQDNLNTHDPSALYTVFEPAEARRMLERLEFHYTPKHGSWLNMAEIELSVLDRQCLDRRIPDKSTLAAETLA